jgi:hypothetical protein
MLAYILLLMVIKMDVIIIMFNMLINLFYVFY